jgi:hypothetical protein
LIALIFIQRSKKGFGVNMSDEEEGGSWRAENYSQNEDIQVCRSWMHINQNPIVGAQQKK